MFVSSSIRQQQHLLVASVVVGDNDTVAVPVAVFSRCLKNLILRQSNVAPGQLPEITRPHLKRILLSPTNPSTTAQQFNPLTTLICL